METVNEPSPEAKQAAEAKDYRQDKGYEYGAFVEGYDAATAKTREDVFNAVFPKGTENGNESWEQILKAIRDTHEELIEAMKQLRESDAELAKLREELGETRENIYAGLDRERDNITTPHLATVAVNALALAREELEIKEQDYLELKRAMWGRVNRLTDELAHQGRVIKVDELVALMRKLVAGIELKQLWGEDQVVASSNYVLNQSALEALGVLKNELAHQQPSIDHDSFVPVEDQVGMQQPSTPTADVEKLKEQVYQALGAASVCWIEIPKGEFDAIRCKEVGDELWQAINTTMAKLRDALAQARAPLVAALAGLVEAVTVEVNEKGAGGYLLARLSDARAALTGTRGENQSQLFLAT